MDFKNKPLCCPDFPTSREIQDIDKSIVNVHKEDGNMFIKIWITFENIP